MTLMPFGALKLWCFYYFGTTVVIDVAMTLMPFGALKPERLGITGNSDNRGNDANALRGIETCGYV